MIDSILEKNLIDYNKARLTAFRNGIEYTHNVDYDRIINARYNKVSRIKKRLVYLLSHRRYHYFLTFTLNDKYIDCCDRTKRDLIKDCLNSFSSDIIYILNIDFGSKTEREHYHCIVGTNSPTDLNQHLLSNYPCFSHCQRIRLTGSDIRKVCKYINKLTNHCCKDSTKNKRIVYNFKGFDGLKDKEIIRSLYLYWCVFYGL